MPRLDLNPSSADRWTTCTASPGFILANADRLVQEDRTFTDPGTAAHEVAAAILLDRKPDTEDREMLWHGWGYAEFVQGLRKPGSELLVERKLPLYYMKERNAVVDAAVNNRDELHIVDYKYGEGVLVSAENNLQATIYAKTVMVSRELLTSDDFPIHIHIYQPRARDGHPFHTWKTTAGEINRLAEKIALAATYIQLHEKNRNAKVEFAPSEKACRWCPARGFCTARQAELTKDIEVLATIDSAPRHFPPAQGLSVRQIQAILTHKKDILKWLDDAEAWVLQYMKQGGSIPGFKLVTGRGGHRYWTNPRMAEKLLLAQSILKREEIIEEKLISPAAAEKLLGKNKFSRELTNLVARPPGQPVIAPEDDPRENALVDAKTEFENLDNF